MIQVFSNYFKIKENCYHDFEWFISDVADLEVIKGKNSYAFSGLSQGYLTTFAIELSCAKEIFFLTEDQYTILNEEDLSLEDDEERDPLVLVDFDLILSKLADTTVQWYEIDLTIMSGWNNKITDTDIDSHFVNLTFGKEGRL